MCSFTPTGQQRTFVLHNQRSNRASEVSSHDLNERSVLTTSCVLIKQLDCDGESGCFRQQIHFEYLNLSHDSKCPDTYDWSRCFRMKPCRPDTQLFIGSPVHFICMTSHESYVWLLSYQSERNVFFNHTV